MLLFYNTLQPLFVAIDVHRDRSGMAMAFSFQQFHGVGCYPWRIGVPEYPFVHDPLSGLQTSKNPSRLELLVLFDSRGFHVGNSPRHVPPCEPRTPS